MRTLFFLAVVAALSGCGHESTPRRESASRAVQAPPGKFDDATFNSATFQ